MASPRMPARLSPDSTPFVPSGAGAGALLAADTHTATRAWARSPLAAARRSSPFKGAAQPRQERKRGGNKGPIKPPPDASGSVVSAALLADALASVAPAVPRALAALAAQAARAALAAVVLGSAQPQPQPQPQPQRQSRHAKGPPAPSTVALTPFASATAAAVAPPAKAVRLARTKGTASPSLKLTAPLVPSTAASKRAQANVAAKGRPLLSPAAAEAGAPSRRTKSAGGKGGRKREHADPAVAGGSSASSDSEVRLREAKQLTQLLVTAPSLHDVVALLGSHDRSVNALHEAAAMSACGRIGGRAKHTLHALQSALRPPTAPSAPRRPVHALTSDGGSLDALSAASTSTLQQAVSLFVCLARTWHSRPESDFGRGGRQASFVLNAAASLGVHETAPALVAAIARSAARTSHAIDVPHSAAVSLRAVSRMNVTEPLALLPLAAAAARLAPSFEGGDAASCLVSLARLRFGDPAILTPIACAAARASPFFRASEAAACLQAAATLNLTGAAAAADGSLLMPAPEQAAAASALVKPLVCAAARSAAHMRPSLAAQCLWALAALNIVDELVWLRLRAAATRGRVIGDKAPPLVAESSSASSSASTATGTATTSTSASQAQQVLQDQQQAPVSPFAPLAPETALHLLVAAHLFPAIAANEAAPAVGSAASDRSGLSVQVPSPSAVAPEAQAQRPRRERRQAQHLMLLAPPLLQQARAVVLSKARWLSRQEKAARRGAARRSRDGRGRSPSDPLGERDPLLDSLAVALARIGFAPRRNVALNSLADCSVKVPLHVTTEDGPVAVWLDGPACFLGPALTEHAAATAAVVAGTIAPPRLAGATLVRNRLVHEVARLRLLAVPYFLWRALAGVAAAEDAFLRARLAPPPAARAAKTAKDFGTVLAQLVTAAAKRRFAHVLAQLVGSATA